AVCAADQYNKALVTLRRQIAVASHRDDHRKRRGYGRNGVDPRRKRRREGSRGQSHPCEDVLHRVGWNRAAESRILKVSYKTLLDRIVDCGLPPSRSRQSANRRGGCRGIGRLLRPAVVFSAGEAGGGDGHRAPVTSVERPREA